jgi:hypothetical protein
MTIKESAVLILMALPITSLAHHSRAEFSVGSQTQELDGELVEIVWRNPHPRFTLRSVNDSGQEELWELEAYGNAASLQRTGITGDNFMLGEQVRVVGRASTRRDRVMLTTHMLLSDGTEAILEYHAGPYWSEQYIGGEETWTIDEEAVLRRAAEENRGIFRVWSIRRRGLDTERFSYTEEAIAGRANFDPLDSFLTRCEQPGMPMTMMRPQRYELINRGETIVLLNQYFDTARTIYMTASEEAPEDQPMSHLGYSVGRWEGNVLVVETSRINWPYLDAIGTPQSEAVESVERFTLSEDQSRLDFHITITDPAMFTEPGVYEKYWLALGEELLPYNCLPE